MTTLFRLFLAAVAIVLLLVAPFVFGQTRPGTVPPEVIADADGTVTVYKGTCPHEGKVMLCMLGFHEEKRMAWMLLFNDHGVLVIIQSQKENEAVKTRWTHPQYQAPMT